MRVLLIALALTCPAAAHDWYPSECCSNKDCAPIASKHVQLVAGGYLVDDIHFVPHHAVRSSPDQQYHACAINPMAPSLRCFFAPRPNT